MAYSASQSLTAPQLNQLSHGYKKGFYTSYQSIHKKDSPRLLMINRNSGNGAGSFSFYRADFQKIEISL